MPGFIVAPGFAGISPYFTPGKPKAFPGALFYIFLFFIGLIISLFSVYSATPTIKPGKFNINKKKSNKENNFTGILILENWKV
jgi:hypothetical protein